MLARAVEEIAEAVRKYDEAYALRLAADLFSALRSLPPDALATAIASDPGSTTVDRWDAMIGGLIERTAHHGGVRTPPWTADRRRFLDFWWFVSPYRSLHAPAMVDSPAELANRGVFIHEASLQSV